MSEESTSRGLGRIGTTIREKYKIERLLGEGGMAVVYVATHRNKKRFAIKMLHPELSIHSDIRARFLKEGYVANTVDHPGAVAVLDDDVAEDGAAFLVMELLDGAPVDALAERTNERLSVKATLGIAHQLLDVLASAHERNVVHRDLKPANLFVTRDGTVKVLDFGIARLREAAQGSAQATGTGMMLGTPAFMPPEQAMAQSSQIDARTDLWAVGATMFTLISGDIVHPGENATQVAIAAATRPARSLATVVAGVPPQVVAIVDKALALNKTDRWASAREMQLAIAAAHRALFGHDVAKDTLTELFREGAPGSATATVPLAQTPVHRRPPRGEELAKTEASGERDLRGRMVGATTAQPFSNTNSSAPPPPLKRSVGAVAVAILIAVTAGGGIGAWALYHPHVTASATPDSAPAIESVSAPGMSSASPTVIASSIAPSVASVDPSRVAVVAVDAGATGTSSTPPRPAAASQPRQPRADAPNRDPAPAAPLQDAIVTKPDPKPTPASPVAPPSTGLPAPTATAKPNCDPPYYVDDTGKHYRAECLK